MCYKKTDPLSFDVHVDDDLDDVSRVAMRVASHINSLVFLSASQTVIATRSYHSHIRSLEPAALRCILIDARCELATGAVHSAPHHNETTATSAPIPLLVVDRSTSSATAPLPGKDAAWHRLGRLHGRGLGRLLIAHQPSIAGW